MTEQIHVREGRTQGKVRVELESICYLEDLGLLLTSRSQPPSILGSTTMSAQTPLAPLHNPQHIHLIH